MGGLTDKLIAAGGIVLLLVAFVFLAVVMGR